MDFVTVTFITKAEASAAFLDLIKQIAALSLSEGPGCHYPAGRRHPAALAPWRKECSGHFGRRGGRG